MKKRQLNRLYLMITITLFLTGCTATTAEPSPSLPVLPAASSTSLPTNTPIPTETVQPTKTQTPTETPKPTIPQSPTDTPAPTQVLSPTQSLVEVTGFTLHRVMDGMVMVYVAEGEFSMGNDSGPTNERPLHKVSLDGFWIDQTEVTNAMFARFMEATGFETNAENRGSAWAFDGKGWSEIPGADWQHPQGPATYLTGLENHPVVNVSWYDAKAYCEWAGARLPSEAEWEKAARGTDGRTYPWGAQQPNGDLLNFGDVNLYPASVDPSLNDGYKFTAPVGSYPAGISPYGALDMGGNVWEWVNDWYQETYYIKAPALNPQGPNSGEGRVFRGGSWNHDSLDIRASIRMWTVPLDAIDNVGFRCAMSLQ